MEQKYDQQFQVVFDVIQKITEKTAREAVNQIRIPIDKARSVAQQQEDKAKEMDDALKKQ